jgi:hypothetical protein
MSVQATRQLARQMLRSMPEDVFDQWIGSQIEINGWPFANIEDSIPSPEWKVFLRGKSLTYWASSKWCQTTFSFSALRLEAAATRNADIVVNYGKTYLNTGSLPTTQVTCSTQRLLRAAAFIRKNGRLPRPIVCFGSDKPWMLLDGTHRLAAMQALSVGESFIVDLWLGANDG